MSSDSSDKILTRGDRIRAAREARGLSQRNLARVLGIGINQINRYEVGANDPAASAIAKIATELKVSADYLLGLSDEPQSHATFELQPNERQLLDAFARGDSSAIFRLVTARLNQLEGETAESKVD